MAYGLRPIQAGPGGAYNSGGFTEYPIADGETDSIFTGTFVVQEASGYVTALATSPVVGSPTVTGMTIGVAVGFRYTDTDGSIKFSTYYPGGGYTNAFAFVADNPEQRFLIKSDGATVQADMGLNAPVVSNSGTASNVAQGSTTTGLSTTVLDQSSQATTTGIALRLLSIPEDGSNESSSTPNVIVKINPAVHQLLEPLGL
tara:strand:- start:555 stop:1157 length:603 start_codon:yes stop_codon:yes gene_type:complete